MTGGEAFIYDPDERFAGAANAETIAWGAPDGLASHRLRALIERHWRETDSPRAKAILDNWASARAAFRHVRAAAAPGKLLAIESPEPMKIPAQ